MESFFTILSIVSPIAGAGFLGAAIFKHRQRNEYLTNSQVIEGVVIRLEPDKQDETLWPHFSAVLPDGSTEEFKGNVGSYPPRFTVGQRVKIHYSAGASPRFLVSDSWEIWFVVRILYVGGILGLLSPLSLLLLRNHNIP